MVSCTRHTIYIKCCTNQLSLCNRNYEKEMQATQRKGIWVFKSRCSWRTLIASIDRLPRSDFFASLEGLRIIPSIIQDSTASKPLPYKPLMEGSLIPGRSFRISYKLFPRIDLRWVNDKRLHIMPQEGLAPRSIEELGKQSGRWDKVI